MPRTGVGLVNRIFNPVKMFLSLPVNQLTDGEICFQIYNIIRKVSTDLVVYKEPFKKLVTKMGYIDTNTKDRVV